MSKTFIIRKSIRKSLKIRTLFLLSAIQCVQSPFITQAKMSVGCLCPAGELSAEGSQSVQFMGGK